MHPRRTSSPPSHHSQQSHASVLSLLLRIDLENTRAIPRQVPHFPVLELPQGAVGRLLHSPLDRHLPHPDAALRVRGVGKDDRLVLVREVDLRPEGHVSLVHEEPHVLVHAALDRPAVRSTGLQRAEPLA